MVDCQANKSLKICRVDIHIGKEIKKIYLKRRFGLSELARLISTSPQNVNALFKRKSVDTDQLFVISKALDYNFFRLYSDKYRGKYLEGLDAAMSMANEPDSEAYTDQLLDDCMKQKRVIEDKYNLQTENATNQRKYIEMLEVKVKEDEAYHREIVASKDELNQQLNVLVSELRKKIEKYEPKKS